MCSRGRVQRLTCCVSRSDSRERDSAGKGRAEHTPLGHWELPPLPEMQQSACIPPSSRCQKTAWTLLHPHTPRAKGEILPWHQQRLAEESECPSCIYPVGFFLLTARPGELLPTVWPSNTCNFLWLLT